jgi:hypothetical protein
MPPVDVKPYVILLAWLKADFDIIAQVGTRVYEGGIPPAVASGLEPSVKYINVYVSAAQAHRRVWFEKSTFMVECVGRTVSAAWDVYVALRGNRRTFNKMTAVVGGNAYQFVLQEVSAGFDTVDNVSEWPAVVSLWQLVSWEQTA